MTSDIVSVEIGRSTWQGPAEEAPRRAGPITMTYRNYRGEIAERRIIPEWVGFGATDWHPEPQWLLRAFDLDKNARRDFALADCQFADLCAAGQQVRAAGDRPIITIYARPTQDEIIAWANSALRNVPDGSLSRAFMRDLIADFADGMDALRADLSPQPEPETRLATREDFLAGEILAELTRAREKFPGKNVTFAALIEEVGELATAVFEEGADRVRKEAVQVAVMAMRMILDGDHCFEPWRAEKGLDPLDPELRALSGGDHG
ncbi:hypothetical protein [Paracoccus pantotrophus]|uniref:hypothetical protein n=1 Tax=Paracoccus pantotrophus TaxID=82367 RepID=UPI0035AEF7E4